MAGITTAPLVSWDGEAFKPTPRFLDYCNRHFVVGERYMIEVIEERSGKHERFFHASLQEAFKNLPESVDDQVQSYDDFRRFCLIKTGWHTLQEYVFPSAKIARQILPVIQEGSEYCIVVMQGNVIRKWKARSQKRGAMNKDEFKASTDAVLEFAATLVGVSPDKLANEAGKAA